MMTTPLLRKTDIPTPGEVLDMVGVHERDTEVLRRRMEADFALLTVAEKSNEGVDDDGYRVFTGNDPATFADKIISWLSSATLLIRVQHGKSYRNGRGAGDDLERFCYGVLRANDERLSLMVQPPLQDQLSWFLPMRGIGVGRCIMAKDPEGTTFVDITPWDPLHVFWSIGYGGLKWICHRSWKSGDEIEEEYGQTIRTNDSGSQNGAMVYDWYNRQYNLVIADGKYMKSPTLHGHSRVPAFLTVVGPMPFIQPRAVYGPMALDSIENWAESIFKDNRGLFDKFNFVMGTMYHLVALTRNRPFFHASRDGSRTLDENPWREGVEVPLAEGENIQLAQLLEMSQDTNAFLQLISGMIQRGALPYSVYGQLAFQLSGYAVRLLQQGSLTPVLPRVKAMERCYSQICNSLKDQYLTGAFDPMQLSGRTSNRVWFDEAISPERLREVGTPEIKMAVALPQDDQTKMAMAQMARQGPTPLLPDITILDEILEMQDADLIQDKIKEQMGERMLPTTALWTTMQALEQRGRTDLAQFFFAELIKLLGPGAVPPPGSVGLMGSSHPSAEGPGVPTQRPEVLPNAEIGLPPPTPNQQAGPVVPPGTPRPGARRATQ